MGIVIQDPRGQVTVYYGRFTLPGQRGAAGLYMLDFKGGPVITLTPDQWSVMVRIIRGVPTAKQLGA